MTWIDAEIAEFGRRIGLPALAPDGAGLCQLQLESGDMLAVEVLEDEVLVYRCHRLPWPEPAALLAALHRCDARRGAAAVQVGLRGTAAETVLVVALRVSAREFTAQRLEQCWDTIQRWLDAWKNDK